MRVLSDLLGDLRHGARLLRLNRGYALIAVFSLALGVGANSSIFQLLNAVRLRNLPVNRPTELFKIRIATADWKPTVFVGQYQEITNPLWERIQKSQQPFSRIAAVGGSVLNISEGGEKQNVQSLWVSGGFFEVLEVPAVLGRVLTAADDHPGCGSSSAVLSYDYWQRHYGGDPGVTGKALTMSGHQMEIVGVSAPGFFGVEVGRSYDIAVPLCTQTGAARYGNALEARDLWWLSVIGRLKPGWTREKASSQLASISAELMRDTAPQGYAAFKIDNYLKQTLGVFPADSGFSALRTRYEDPLWAMLAIAGVVLLIACANLANLMLARAGAREREIAVRLAIGATRSRLARQMLAESLMLAAAGSLLGLFLAFGLSRLLVAYLNSFGSRGSSVFLDLSLDYRVIGFTLGATLLTTILFGLAPALRGSRVAPAAALVSGRGPASGGGHGLISLRNVLVVVQVTLSLGLIVSGLLFSRSLGKLLDMDAGFRQQGILRATLDYVRLNLPVNQRHDFKRNMLDRIRAVPGVSSVAETTIIPAGGNYWSLGVRLGGESSRPIKFNWVSPGYFATMDTTLRSGRDFDGRDTEAAPKVAVVNEAFGQSFFGGENPIGKTFTSEAEPGYPEAVYQVIGVARNSKYQNIRESFQPVVFAPEAQHPSPTTFQVLFIRSDAAPGPLIDGLKRAVSGVNPEITMDFDPFRNYILRQLLRERLMAALSGFFAGLAALLATMGLYGVLSYVVVQRTREVGIRMAIGATPGSIVGMMLGQAATLVGIGLALGTVLALFSLQAAGKLLFGLSPRDPASFAGAALLLSLAALGAAYVPARRASRLQPMEALRQD